MSVAERVLGTPVDRIEGAEKVRGEAKYAYEYELENVLYAVLAVTPVAKGAIRAVDTEAALASPGVVAVLTHENAPKLPKQDGELGVLQSPITTFVYLLQATIQEFSGLLDARASQMESA